MEVLNTTILQKNWQMLQYCQNKFTKYTGKGLENFGELEGYFLNIAPNAKDLHPAGSENVTIPLLYSDNNRVLLIAFKLTNNERIKST